MSYLDLRRVQNTEWATDRLREGVRFAKEGKATKAEECYKEGIDLVPTHAPLFVAYGALCANLGRTREAIDKLEHALELDPNVPNAQAYMDAIQNKVPPRQAGSVSRSQTAMKDALMEQSFLQESQSCADNENEKYPLVHEEKMDTNHNHEEKKTTKPSESVVTKRPSEKASTGIDPVIARVGQDENDTNAMTLLVTMILKVMILQVTIGTDGDGTDDTLHRKSQIECTGLAQTKRVKNPIEDDDVIENGTNDDDESTLRMHHLMDQVTRAR